VPFAVKEDVLQSGGAYLQKNGYKKREKKLNFLFIGRLVYYKGCTVLIEAFSKMKQDAELTIIGDGVLKEELMKQAAAGDAADRIRFAGRVDDEELKHCMEEADVFVLPSVERSEAFGLVQLEAMAYGTPVINTNLASGVPEVSIHGETGLTAAPGDAESLAAAMEWMCTHPEERIQMGIAARKRLEEMFTEEKPIKNLREIYEDAGGKD
jgi:rhamnosyl/mannosyltransferase